MDTLKVRITLNDDILIDTGCTISEDIKEDEKLLELLLVSFFKERGLQVKEKMYG